MGAKPMVFLDVDGVVNAYPDEGNEDRFVAGRYMVFIDPETVDVLRELFRHTEVVWLTAWRNSANRDILPVLREEGILSGDRPFLTDSDGPNGSGAQFIEEAGFSIEWKLGALERSHHRRRALEAERPVFWIEDFGWSFHDYRHMRSPSFTQIVDLGVTPIDTVKETTAKLLWSDVERHEDLMKVITRSAGV